MQKIKQFLESQQGKDIMTVFIVILVGLAAFGLGRMSKESSQGGLKIQYLDQEALAVQAISDLPSFAPKASPDGGAPAGKEFFASSKGQKYYPADCSAGKNIKTKNRVYFESREEAQIAGYELSSSCR